MDASVQNSIFIYAHISFWKERSSRGGTYYILEFSH